MVIFDIVIIKLVFKLKLVPQFLITNNRINALIMIYYIIYVRGLDFIFYKPCYIMLEFVKKYNYLIFNY